jgi:hypothetical protein
MLEALIIQTRSAILKQELGQKTKIEVQKAELHRLTAGHPSDSTEADIGLFQKRFSIESRQEAKRQFNSIEKVINHFTQIGMFKTREEADTMRQSIINDMIKKGSLRDSLRDPKEK